MPQPEEMPEREELQRVDTILKQDIMRRAEYKRGFIEVWKLTLEEYRKHTHNAEEPCLLCDFDMDYSLSTMSLCDNCMNGQFRGDLGSLGCGLRYNEYYYCNDDTKKKQNVIEFFELALLWMQTIPEEHWYRVGDNLIFEGIKDIDEYVWHQHQLQ